MLGRCKYIPMNRKKHNELLKQVLTSAENREGEGNSMDGSLK